MQHADLSRGSLAESAGLSRMSLAESTHLDLRKNGPHATQQSPESHEFAQSILRKNGPP